MKINLYLMLTKFMGLIFFFSVLFGVTYFFKTIMPISSPTKPTTAQGLIGSVPAPQSNNEVETYIDISDIPKLDIAYVQSTDRIVRVYLKDGKNFLVPHSLKKFIGFFPGLLAARKSSARGGASKTYINRHLACYNDRSQTVYIPSLGKRISVSDSCKALIAFTVKSCNRR